MTTAKIKFRVAGDKSCMFIQLCTELSRCVPTYGINWKVFGRHARNRATSRAGCREIGRRLTRDPTELRLCQFVHPEIERPRHDDRVLWHFATNMRLPRLVIPSYFERDRDFFRRRAHQELARWNQAETHANTVLPLHR